MKAMLLTREPDAARMYREAAKNTERIRLCTVRTIPQMLEQLYREPFDALISDDPYTAHPRIRKCPVLWPNQFYLLLHDTSALFPLSDEITYCFPFTEDPKRILTLVESLPGGQTRRNDAECRISRFLQQTGFPVSLSGFDCLKEAIRLILQQEHMTDIRSVNDLYDVVAEMMCVSASVAEHAMRHAIDTAWMLADPDALEMLFGDTIHSERAAPSNAAFLFRAADHIRINQKGDPIQ